MNDDNDAIYEQPTHWIIEFEGEVTVPTENEDFAKMEVVKALEQMCIPFKLYGDHRDPSYSVWSESCYTKIVDKKGKNYKERQKK